MQLFDRPWCKNRRFYLGEVRMHCTCHGYTRAYALKIAGVISIVLKRHYPQVWLQFGQNAKIMLATPETWKMAGDRIKQP